MNTTTYTGTGVNGQAVRKELADKGEIVVVTTGTPKTGGLRRLTGEVVGHTARTITGTQFFVWETVVRTAEGEITDTRIRPATAAEAAEFTAAPAADAVEIECPEDTAHGVHVATCIDCRPGRACAEGMALWTARHDAQHWTRTPIVVATANGGRHGFWSMEAALAKVAISGGEVIKAPAGMMEAVARKREARRLELDARRAARPAGRRRAALGRR